MKPRKRFGNFRGNYTRRPSRKNDANCESLWGKMTGKPYSGKVNVRFDEGELEIGHGQAIRHCQTKGAETDRPNLNYYANSLLYPFSSQWTRGVRRILGNGNGPTPIDNEVVEFLLEQTSRRCYSATPKV